MYGDFYFADSYKKNHTHILAVEKLKTKFKGCFDLQNF